MNEVNGTRPQQTTPEENTAVRLLKMAGPRPAPSAERTARVRSAVHGRWQHRARRRVLGNRFFWTAMPVAAAATVAVGIGLSVWLTGPATVVPEGLATVEVVSGTAWSMTDGEDERTGRRTAASAGHDIAADTVLLTGKDGRVALRLASGQSLRLDHDTRVHLVDGKRFLLERGAVYVDSGLDGALQPALNVLTRFGGVHETGTQFEVRLVDNALRVRVREGKVRVENGGEAHEVEAGVEATLGIDGRFRTATLPPHGPHWQWVLEVAPPFALERSSLADFLGWVSRETGLELEYGDAALADSAPGIVLHGEIADLRPDQAPAAVLPTCGLRHRVRNGVLVITQAEATH